MKPGRVIRLGDFSSDIYDFERFGTQPVAVQEHVLAMSSHSHLLMAHLGGVLDSISSPSSSSFSLSSSESALISNNPSVIEQPVISRVAIEYLNKDLDDRINTIAWVTTDVVACGFESGLVQGYRENGDKLFQFRGPVESCVSSIKVFVEGQGEEVLWILFEKGTIVGVSIIL